MSAGQYNPTGYLAPAAYVIPKVFEMPWKESRVLPVPVYGPFHTKEAQSTLNEMASEGYKFIAASTGRAA